MAKLLKNILGEVAQPKAGDEKRFKDKHEIQDTPYPAKDADEVLNARKSKKDKTRQADLDPQEQEDMYEAAFNEVAIILSEDEDIVLENVVETIQNISKNKKEEYVTLNDGTEIEVDPETADSIVNVLEFLTPENQKVFVSSLEQDEESFLRMVDFAISMRDQNG